MRSNTLFLIAVLLSSCAAFGQPGGRIKLTQLEQAPLIDGSRAGMIGLSNAAGDQRYAFYVNINDTCMATAPTPTGNTIVSIFWQKCATDSIWYVDWEGLSILLSPFGGGAQDQDWLEIGNNQVPDNINDSIYTYKYASVGARYVWPLAQFLVSDSLLAALQVIQGSRNARLALFDLNAGTSWTMLDHGGSTPLLYIPNNANFLVKTSGGTPQAPGGTQVNHFGVNAQDSTLQGYRYPNTRTDTNTVINFLYTDAVGKFRSRPVGDFPGAFENIYNTSGNILADTVREINMDSAAVLAVNYPNGPIALFIASGPDSTGLGSELRLSTADELNEIIIEDGGIVEIRADVETRIGDTDASGGGTGIYADIESISMGTVFGDELKVVNVSLDGVEITAQDGAGTGGTFSTANDGEIFTRGSDGANPPSEWGFAAGETNGFYALLHGMGPNEGDILRVDGTGRFVFSDTLSNFGGGNIYTTSGNILADTVREIRLDSTAILAVIYPDGDGALNIYGGVDSSATGGYVEINSESANTGLNVEDGLIRVKSDGVAQIGDLDFETFGYGATFDNTAGEIILGDIFGPDETKITIQGTGFGDQINLSGPGIEVEIGTSPPKFDVDIDDGNEAEMQLDVSGFRVRYTDNGGGNGIDLANVGGSAHLTQDSFSMQLRNGNSNGSTYSILEYDVSETTAGVDLVASDESGDKFAGMFLHTDANAGAESVEVQITAFDANAPEHTLAEIRLDTGGISIQTQGGVGSDGALLHSDGVRSFWAGNGAFNADQLSYTPGAPDRWTAVTANRTNAQIAIGTLTPSEAVTHIVVDTAATTSTVNLNYTPDSRYNANFTTERWITNWGSGNCTVETDQSWFFKTSTTSAGTLTIGPGETYKLIWNSATSPARFYCIKVE